MKNENGKCETRQPIALHKELEIKPALELEIIGWGKENEDDKNLPESIRTVNIPVLSDADCKKAFGSNVWEVIQICAGLNSGT